MDQDVQSQENLREQLINVEAMKSCIDDMYKNKMFYSLSLHTLELTRRFNKKYQLYSEVKEEGILQELLALTRILEEKLFSAKIPD